MSGSSTAPGDQVRLVPDGCDYVLRGVARVRADGDEVPVRAIAPGGTAVIAQIPLDAPGLVIVEHAATPGGELLVQLQNVFVSASRVLPAS